MAFDSLSDKLQNVFKKLRSKGVLTEDDVKEAMKEVKRALLEADVNFKVVKSFIKAVSDRAVGEEVLKGLNPGHMVIKIVKEEMDKLMGSDVTELKLLPSNEITVIMMCGLQGAGKTTTAAKLAYQYKNKGKKPLLVACDVYRPAAIKQLQINGEKVGVPVFTMGDNHKPLDIAKAAILHASKNNMNLVFIDTAGLRRKSKIKEDIERYSIIRTVAAVERCNVAVLVIDATEGITDQDAKIAGIAHERGKGMIIVVNKWDAIEKDDKTIYRFTKEIRDRLSYMPYAELLFVSAQTGQRLAKLFDTIDAVIENHSLRIATGVLNEIMTEAVAMQQPPSDKGKRLKLFYITQVAVKPPTFVIFVNEKELMHFSYTRYIENKIREAFGFRGTPLKFIIRERKEK